MQISITVTPDEHEQLRAIADALAGITEARSGLKAVRQILHEDRPDVGLETLHYADTSTVDKVPTAAAVFGSAEAQQLQLQHAAVHTAVPPLAEAQHLPPLGAPAAISTPFVDTSPSAAQGLVPAETDAPNPQPPQVDCRGLPWDARIHASTKAVNADGTWRAKRGVNDPAFVQRVEGELRQIMSAPAVPPLPTPPAFISQEAAAVGLPVAPAAPVAAVHPLDFAGLMNKATELMTAQKLTREELEQCAQAVGLPSIVGAVTRVDLVPTISAHIDTIVGAKG
jgi:hypothetical protein